MIDLGQTGFQQFNYDFRLAREYDWGSPPLHAFRRRDKLYNSVADVAMPPPGADIGVFPVKYATLIVLRLRAVGLI